MAVDPHDVLERSGDPGLPMRLQFRDVDHGVSVKHRLGNEVLIGALIVVTRHDGYVVVRHTVVPVAG